MSEDDVDETDEIEDVDRRETMHSGGSIVATLKRGEGTRDEDRLKIKGKGATAEEAIEEFESELQAAEDRNWPDRLRALQPGEEEEDGQEAGDGDA